MFSKKMTNKSTNACLAQINRLKEKMEKAHDFAVKAAQTTKGKTVITTVQRKLTGSEIFLTVLYSVNIAGAVFFDIFVGIKLIKNKKSKKQAQDGGSLQNECF